MDPRCRGNGGRRRQAAGRRTMSTRGVQWRDGVDRSRGIGVFARAWIAVVAASAGSTGPVLAAGTDRVTITGGADDTAHNYTWTVTNRHVSPIVQVEFPHYHADTFMVPPGWTQRCTYLVNVGVEDRPGVCTATAPAGDGIARGESVEFGMRICAAGANVGRGNVTVRFADGSEAVVAGVSLPEASPTSTKYMPLVGLAVIFVLVVVIRERRRRRSSADASEEPAESPPQAP